MTNHVHLLLTPYRVESVTDLMRAANQRYVQHVNRKLGRTGSLWEGRFRSSVIDSEGYFFTCHRYIETNPMRAGMVDSPAGYSWSSYRVNAEGARSLVVVPHDLYMALGLNDHERRLAYRGLFQRELSSWQLGAIRDAIRGGRPLGHPKFVGEMGELFGPRVQPQRLGRPRNK